MATLERALKIDPERLRALNPALLRSVWDGQQRVPKAYHLRLPLDGTPWTRELLAQRLSPAEMFAGQSSPPHYRVQRGDTLASVAQRYGVTAETLARLNRVRTSARLPPPRRAGPPPSPPRSSRGDRGDAARGARAPLSRRRGVAGRGAARERRGRRRRPRLERAPRRDHRA